MAHSGLLMVIILVPIGDILLVDIGDLLMVIILVPIGGYYIYGYWWIFC